MKLLQYNVPMLKIFTQNISKLAVSLRKAFQWHRFGNKPNSLLGALVKVFRLVEGKTSRSLILGILFSVRVIAKLFRSMGPRGLALYLKASAVAVMRASAGKPLKAGTSSLGIRVKLTGGGIPCWIPPVWRSAIKGGDRVITKRVLTVCNLYRVLDFKGKLNIATITAPFSGRVVPALINFIPVFWELLGNPSLPSFKWQPLLISTAGPGRAVRNTSNSLGNILTNLWSLHLHDLWPVYISLAELFGCSGHIVTLREVLTIMASEPGFFPYKTNLPIGKLATKDEPGKVRVFAMVDFWTQSLLYPFHRWVFDHILKKIWNDATFDQGEGVRKIAAAIKSGCTKVYSFDLSAATDRLPVLIQSALLNGLKENLGTWWAALLVERDYEKPGKTRETVRYAVGQPMGAYSSWALLALTHHFIVQFAAFKVGYRGWFVRYMVLGDDIVIWDDKVASYYAGLMRQLGVAISPTKSIVSRNGGAEFAKRFLVKGEDASPVSLAEVQVAAGSLEGLKELTKRHSQELKPGDVAKFQGKGYKAMSRMQVPFKRMSRSMGYMLLFLLMPGVSSLSMGCWLDWFRATGWRHSSSLESFSCLAKLAAYFQDKLPKVPRRFGPFDYVEAILGITETGLKGYIVHTGEEGSLELLELELGALFGAPFHDAYIRDQGLVRKAGIQFKRREYPVSPSGVDQAMEDIKLFQPALSTWSVPEGEWETELGFWGRTSRDEKVHFSLANWFKLHAIVQGRQ